MNSEIYKALCGELKKNVPELRFVAWDNGHLNAQERPAINYPACLIDINYSNCKDITDFEQIVTVNIILKIVCQPIDEDRQFDLLESIHDTMQGCTLDNTVSAISRRSAVKSVRKDRLVVYTMQYDTTFEEIA